MKIKIAVFGSAVNDHDKQIAEKIKALGETLSKKEVIIITGACTGIPYQVASVAYKKK